jgi:hypothetical protein
MNLQEAIQAFAAERAHAEAAGMSWHPSVAPRAYVPDGFGSNYGLAMDAQPSLQTDPNSAVPAMLTTLIDPQVYEIVFAPNKAAEILGENRKGTWLDETAMFPSVEHTGEVSSYGDYANNGVTGVNTNWPQRQSYLFQTIKQYGERELERAGLARINWVSELDKAAATVLNKFSNLTYFFGVTGLQNYGLINDPNLPATLTPATKAGSGLAWFSASGAPVATANEVYNDILTVYTNLVQNTAGLVDDNSDLVLALDPTRATALKFANTFNVNVETLLKTNFSKLRIVTAIQYGALTTANPQGNLAGNFMQMIATSIEGQQTGYAAFNEKMRSHQIVPGLSNWMQKVSGGTWGSIIRMPVAFASMTGI